MLLHVPMLTLAGDRAWPEFPLEMLGCCRCLDQKAWCSLHPRCNSHCDPRESISCSPLTTGTKCAWSIRYFTFLKTVFLCFPQNMLRKGGWWALFCEPSRRWNHLQNPLNYSRWTKISNPTMQSLPPAPLISMLRFGCVVGAGGQECIRSLTLKFWVSGCSYLTSSGHRICPDHDCRNSIQLFWHVVCIISICSMVWN